MRYNLLFFYLSYTYRHLYAYTAIVDSVCQSYFIFRRIVTDITHLFYRHSKKKKKLPSQESHYTISSMRVDSGQSFVEEESIINNDHQL